MSFSAKNETAINMEKALEYPLFPVPLSIAHPDGTRRTNQKSDLLGIIKNHHKSRNIPLPSKNNAVFIIDIIAQIHTITEVPVTFENLIWRVLKSIPTDYEQVHIVADYYKENSIKKSERDKRGSSPKVLIKSVKSKVPREFQFLLNGDNKTS